MGAVPAPVPEHWQRQAGHPGTAPPRRTTPHMAPPKPTRSIGGKIPRGREVGRERHTSLSPRRRSSVNVANGTAGTSSRDAGPPGRGSHSLKADTAAAAVTTPRPHGRIQATPRRACGQKLCETGRIIVCTGAVASEGGSVQRRTRPSPAAVSSVPPSVEKHRSNVSPALSAEQRYAGRWSASKPP